MEWQGHVAEDHVWPSLENTICCTLCPKVPWKSWWRKLLRCNKIEYLKLKWATFVCQSGNFKRSHCRESFRETVLDTAGKSVVWQCFFKRKSSKLSQNLKIHLLCFSIFTSRNFSKGIIGKVCKVILAKLFIRLFIYRKNCASRMLAKYNII